MFKREGINSQQSHQSQVIQSTWRAYINHNRAVHWDFYTYYFFFFSFSAQLVRLCDNEDLYDPSPGWLPFLYYYISENKTELKK